MGGESGSLELDCGVINLKFLGGFFLDGAEQAFALVHVHIGNAGVEAQSIMAGAKRPDVDVVDFLDALDGEDGAGYFLDAHFSGAAFEKDVGGLAEDADAGPED